MEFLPKVLISGKFASIGVHSRLGFFKWSSPDPQDLSNCQRATGLLGWRLDKADINMSAKNDLQHLLPETARDELLVAPKKSFQFGTLSVSVLMFGLGMAVGTLALGSTVGVIALVVCFIVSRVLGIYLNRNEAAVMSRFKNEPGNPQS